ncbi:hypothetical protein Q9L58_005454 [Maublancomyces gigas]|uniref:Uncharacterized protein n=1 Tax=Discina gigas TaxID=1032678 RepID=A0ABR3GIG8_9PEZI
MSSSPVTSVAKGRKGSAAGGGKAWTEEEEVYLLQMRLERVAYKKIASHLDKTELACRLHYHQLSHGGNRRKRNNSISSTSSNASATSPVASPSSGTPLASKTRSSSPQSSFSPVNASGAIQKVGTNIPSKIKGKPLLPKPIEPSPRKHTISKGNKLRVNCNPDSIDKEKLIRIVEAQRACFWESVATQYGGSVDPEFLAKCWQKGFTSTPPTPAISPSTKAISPSPVTISEDGHNTASTVATSSEASTPSSAPLTPSAFTGPEVSVKEETMEDRLVEDNEIAPQETPAATAASTPTALEAVTQTIGDSIMED